MPSHVPRLLIVDDDSHIRDLAEFAARQSGKFGMILLAHDGAAAARMLWRADPNGGGAELPDVVLTDLSMPEPKLHSPALAGTAEKVSHEANAQISWLPNRAASVSFSPYSGHHV